VLIDPHAAFQALNGSFQTLYDYLLSTNAPEYTDPLVLVAGASFEKMYEKVASAPPFTPLADGSAFPSLTGERVKLRRGESGLGFRPLGERFLYLN
jgi:hypothetical protein